MLQTFSKVHINVKLIQCLLLVFFWHPSVKPKIVPFGMLR